MNAVVSEKGQVTIPKELREQLGLSPGTILAFRTEGGKLIAQKSLQGDPLDKWWGKGKLPAGFKNVEDYLRSTRHGKRG
jgi:antitoxin PrlF